MKVALITASVGDFDSVSAVPSQSVGAEVELTQFCFTEHNLPFPLPNLDNRMKSKYLKLQMHKYLPGFDVYIWIDGRVQITSTDFVREMLEQLHARDLVLLKHEHRSNVFEEMDFILKHIREEHKYLFLRYGDQQMEKEWQFYSDNRSMVKDIPLFASGIFARVGERAVVNELFDTWWNKVIQYSCFDQAMLSYIVAEYSDDIVYRMLTWSDIVGPFIEVGKHRVYPTHLSTSDVLYTIQEHLVKQLPLSIVRYGDGEAMLLDKDPSSEDKKDFVFKRQLGSGFTNEEDRKEIIANLIMAYKGADIVGRPTKRHEKFKHPDYWAQANPILSQYISMDKLSCNIDVFYAFLKVGAFDTLLRNRKRLFYISARNLDQQITERFGIDRIDRFLIAPEMKFTLDYVGDKHYPDQFNQIAEWMHRFDLRGELCLIGAGVTGKLYANWFRDLGGVGIDIGGVFDLWAGKNTRGEGRGPNVTDDTHKL